MAQGISINRSIVFFLATVIACLLAIVSFFISEYSNGFKSQYQQNLRSRSSLFKKSIESDLVMGDYSSVLEKANSFFHQDDVNAVKIILRDRSTIVELQKDTLGKVVNDSLATHETIAIDSVINQSRNAVASVDIQYSIQSLMKMQSRIMAQGLIACSAVACIAAIGIFYFSRLLNNPLRNLSETVSSGKLEVISKVEPRSLIRELRVLENAVGNMGMQIIELNEREKENIKSAAVGRTISHLSHDMRAPLGAIERLLSLPDGIMISSQKRDIAESLGRLHAMIESLRHADLELLITPQDWTPDFRIALLGIEAKAAERGIVLREPRYLVKRLRVDPLKFERAWVNLASNAIDAAKSEVRIEAEAIGSEFLLRVIDDGPGVPNEFLPRLFKRGATTGKADGTGLGLAYVRQIMRGHGGDVTYRRENGLTIFECRLPNAVECEKDQAMESKVAFEAELKQKKVYTVAISLEPEQLSASILAKLASLNSEDFFFTSERSKANFVVSNIEDVMFETLERDDQEFVSVRLFDGDEARIIELLKKKFNLT